MGVKQIFNHSLWIAWKDLLEFSRSKLRLVMLVLMPLFMMVMVGFIFPSQDTVSDVPIALVNLDEGSQDLEMGDAFVAQLEAINNQKGFFKFQNATDFEDIKSRIQSGDVSGGIIISRDFSSSFFAGMQGNITLVTDQTNPQLSLILEGILTEVIESMGSVVAKITMNETYEIPANRTEAILSPYHVEVEGIIPGEPNYFQFVAPGIMAMVVMMSLMTGLPHAISYEKDIGTLDGMLVAPINRLAIIIGKVLAQTTRGMIQGFIILVLAILIFGVTIYGSILLVILLLFLGVFSFVGLGILITSFTENEETASMLMMTFMFPMMFLSGVFFPIQQMPWFMQRIAYLLPLTYATTALRKVIILGAGVSAITIEILVMVGFGVVLLAVAVPMFKRAMSK
ncbi:MAG: ABC transporter permease [Thermoplasmata archaeon]|nr:MAG: ABC transporter permease [Thermoplasmata archaeon]